MQYTEGPWRARMQLSGARYGNRMLGWIIEAANGDRIGWSNYATARTNEGDEAPYAQSGANARLVAEAPAMDQLLHDMAVALDAIQNGDAPDGDQLRALLNRYSEHVNRIISDDLPL